MGLIGLILLGIMAFALFFLSDINDLRLSKKALAAAFPVGCIALSAGVIGLCIQSGVRYPIYIRLPFMILAFVFFLMMLFSLFGALSISDAYASSGKKRSVYTKGVYEMCRHPGVLWFILLFVCLRFAFGLGWIDILILCALNVLLALFEDRIVFPKVLMGYQEYRKTTPFLIPTPSGVRRMIEFYRKRR